MTLRPYQEKAITEVATKLAAGTKNVLLQLATGAGKTVIFSAISSRYISKNDTNSVLILVHRKELLQQTRRALFNHFGISPQIIVSGMKHIPPARVYVGMIETVNKRIEKIKGITMLIIDECHINAFNKIHKFFPSAFIIGVTATPLSASKKDPLKNYYDDIVCGVDIPKLIADGYLAQNITYSPRDLVDRAALTVKGNDFDESKMCAEFSKPKNVANTLAAYNKHAPGNKTVIFNVNIEHSKKVNNAFVIAGYDARHLDGEMDATERSNILKWFENTDGAIINSVGILTAGWDCVSIECVIMNRATMSMPLWIQCVGRGARVTQFKKMFTILDLGSNVFEHGDFNAERNWASIFHNPHKKKKDEEGISPCKSCPECDCIVAASTRICGHCGYLFPAKQEGIETALSDFIIVTKNINVPEIIAANAAMKEYYPFFLIGKELAIQAKNTVPKMTNEIAEFILEKYNVLAKEWCHAVGKKYNQWHKDRAREHLYTELAERFKKWESPVVQVSVPVIPLHTHTFTLPSITMKNTMSI